LAAWTDPSAAHQSEENHAESSQSICQKIYPQAVKTGKYESFAAAKNPRLLKPF
jgi:hypothetical protein